MNRAHDSNYVKDKLSSLYIKSSVCFHEAGHVIMGLLHLMRIDVVKICENEDIFTGSADYDLIFSKNDDLEIFNYNTHSEILLFYAGLNAERLHFKKISGSDQFPLILKEGSGPDTQDAYRLIKKHVNVSPGIERYKFKKKMVKQSQKILEENWDAVVLVAHALFKRKKLNFNDLKKLLTTKTENKEFWKDKFIKINFLFKSKNLTENEVKKILFS